MKRILIFFFGFLLLGIQSCSEFLDSKPNRNLVIPQSLDDFQQMLDAELRGLNDFYMNGLFSSDDIYFSESLLSLLSFSQTSFYFWEADPYLPDEWDAGFASSYRKILYANLVLEGLENYEPANELERNRVLELESSARFFRALGHYEVLLHFAPPYDPSQPDQLGISIRLASDINVKNERSTMKECFDQIIEDLEFGLDYLPTKAEIPTRPSLWASNAFLGRVFLNMLDYEKAYTYSKTALDIDNSLMDFKMIDSELPYSFEVFHEETIFYQKHLTSRHTTNGGAYVNPELVELYDSTDLRKTYFLLPSSEEGLFNFRGNYTGDFYHFGGLAVDEVILNYAESAFRIGEEVEALEQLNYLLENRYEEGFEAISELSGQDLLEKIVMERRKELVYRGLRWLDLKRFNLYPELAVTLDRTFNERQATLPPNDLRYAFLIPPAEINLNPIQQNPR
ncbi:RagB/SusD family nutrient uptake outer membrane protein [Algoriphagus formosus]|uniref:RagB/SusD family nutrient uptake outer membrane protein n=1 Tax=Algoriphagus formosus TaxID=2007308 RepID=UPI000C289BD5|nr:RagB/SusD family nutrient uptake outer membrane protein [Algoriphagus formosus]